MAGLLPNFHKMDSRSACIEGVLKVKVKVKVKVKGHVIRTLSWILGMSYSVIDGLVWFNLLAYLLYCVLLRVFASFLSLPLSVCFLHVNLPNCQFYMETWTPWGGRGGSFRCLTL